MLKYYSNKKKGEFTMFFYEAFKLFNDELDGTFNENFTKQELKKAFKSIIKLYHPDLYPNATPEEIDLLTYKTQMLNEAYKALKTHITILEEPTKETTLSNTKRYYLEKLTQYFSDIPEDAPEYFNQANIKIIQIIQKYNQMLALFNTKEKIVSNFNGYKAQIIAIIGQVITEYFKDNNLAIEMISSDTNLKTLLTTLSSIKEKRDAKAHEAIENITREFELYTSYPKLKYVIERLKNEALTKLITTKEPNVSKTLKLNIAEVFQNYYEDIKKARELVELTKNIDDKIITDYIAVLKTNVTNHLLFENYASIITARLAELNAEKNQKYANQDPHITINETYYNVETRAQELLQKQAHNPENTNYINMCLKQISEFMSLAKEGMLSAQSFELLNNLTFTDANEDMYVLLAVKYNLPVISKEEIDKIILNESIEQRCHK